MSDLKAIEKRTQEVYERNAVAFDRQRSKGLHERKWLDRFARDFCSGSRILDLGCGAGEPIASYAIARGFRVTGLDFSSAMLEMAKQRFPSHSWYLGDMRSLALNEKFHGIIAWNSFFHLTCADQKLALPRISSHLMPGGNLMLTVGPSRGETIGYVNGEEVYHASLSPEDYRTLLGSLGLKAIEFVFEDKDCGRQTVLLAKKS